MEVKDIFKTNNTFELEGKSITFKIIPYNVAIKAQNAIHYIATNEPKNISEGNKILLDLALQHAIINDNEGGADIESPSLQLFASLFENPFASAELSAQFRDYVLGFLNRLPSFQQVSGKEQA